MRLVDANVLVYAVDRNAPHHCAAKAWLDGALGGTVTVLLPWIATLAFVRLVTHPRVFAHPLPTSQALDVVHGWLSQPAALAAEPDHRHLLRLREMLEAVGGRGGNLVNDAHLAALAVQYNATVVSYDSDFDRFPGLTRESP